MKSLVGELRFAFASQHSPKKQTTHTQIRIIWELKIILSELWDSMWAPISKGSKTGKHSSVGVCKGAVKTHIHRIKSLI